jgi:uncharacterized protein YndB with AHSA1/START domain
MWFDVEAVPLSFTESSPYHIETVTRIEAPPARVFEIWATAEAQVDWFQDWIGHTWTTKEPYGVGSERVANLKLLSVKERFLAWDPGKRMSFHIYAITLPLVKAMLEDMTFAPDGEGATRFTWRVHYRPSLLMRMVHPIGRAIFGKMFRSSADGLARYAKEHPVAGAGSAR